MKLMPLDLIGVELAQHGATVKGVPSAEEALKALKAGAFDLLISDIGMPNASCTTPACCRTGGSGTR